MVCCYLPVATVVMFVAEPVQQRCGMKECSRAIMIKMIWKAALALGLPVTEGLPLSGMHISNTTAATSHDTHFTTAFSSYLIWSRLCCLVS